eukprot:2038758-Amphidinium_carterae.2
MEWAEWQSYVLLLVKACAAISPNMERLFQELVDVGVQQAHLQALQAKVNNGLKTAQEALQAKMVAMLRSGGGDADAEALWKALTGVGWKTCVQRDSLSSRVSLSSPCKQAAPVTSTLFKVLVACVDRRATAADIAHYKMVAKSVVTEFLNSLSSPGLLEQACKAALAVDETAKEAATQRQTAIDAKQILATAQIHTQADEAAFMAFMHKNAPKVRGYPELHPRKG